MSMNKFIGIGRWSKEIELRYTPAGKAVASSDIAISEKYNGSENTTFLPVVMWGKTAENVAQFSKKGRLVLIEGRIQVRTWDSDNGRRYITEVVADNVRFLESSGGQKEEKKEDPFNGEGAPITITDDDLPF